MRGHGNISHEFIASLKIFFLKYQRLIIDNATTAGKTEHLALLLARWHQLEFKSLKSFHSVIILRSMAENNDIRRGRHCVFNMHVHLVFVTKYRRDVFTKDILEALHPIYDAVCKDFEAILVEFDGEDDHVHLLVNYPPKVTISKLVNSLKGVSSLLIRKMDFPSIKKKLWGGALWSPSYFAASCGGAPISIIRAYIEQQRTPH